MSTHAHSHAHSEHAPAHSHAHHADHAEHVAVTHPEAANENQVEDAARQPLPVPEAHDAVQAATANDNDLVPEPVKPPIKLPPQAAASHRPHDPANDTNLVVDEELRSKAERELASYIGSRINPLLTDGLVLNLLEMPNHGKAGIELCFTGPALTTNSALFEQEVVEALKTHPQFGPLFAHKETALHGYKPNEPEKQNMMHIQAPHLSVEQYGRILHGIANPVPKVTPSADPVGTPVTPKEAANDGAIGLVQTDAKPEASIQAPVAALDKIQDTTQQVQM